MNSRERFLTTLDRKEPDRPPLIATVTPQVAQMLSSALGLSYEPPYDSMLSTRISHMDLLTYLGNDAVGVAACYPDDSPTRVREDGLMENEWGMIMKDIGLYGEFYDFPLKNTETKQDLDKYSFPDPQAAGRYRIAAQNINKYQSQFGIYGDLEISIFETAWYLTGLEKLLMDLMLEPEYLEPLLDQIMYINTETGKELIRRGVDMLWCGDDFGTQKGMIMDPGTWRKFFKHRIKAMFEAFRSVNPDIKIAWHSCGSILPIIPEFIEIGLDILNPIQPLAKGMDPEFLKKEYGKDLIFFGGICVQDLLPNGTVQKIKDEVKRRAEILGKGGGYIIGPAHNIQVDTPLENILALFEAVKEL